MRLNFLLDEKDFYRENVVNRLSVEVEQGLCWNSLKVCTCRNKLIYLDIASFYVEIVEINVIRSFFIIRVKILYDHKI